MNFKRANENLFQKVKDQTVAVQVLKETVRTEMKENMNKILFKRNKEDINKAVIQEFKEQIVKKVTKEMITVLEKREEKVKVENRNLMSKKIKESMIMGDHNLGIVRMITIINPNKDHLSTINEEIIIEADNLIKEMIIVENKGIKEIKNIRDKININMITEIIVTLKEIDSITIQGTIQIKGTIIITETSVKVILKNLIITEGMIEATKKNKGQIIMRMIKPRELLMKKMRKRILRFNTDKILALSFISLLKALFK